MRDGGRLAAAIAVLAEVEGRGRPVRLALKAWGEGARYAGAADRAFVSGLVLDALRRRRSLCWRMGDESPRAQAVAALAFAWDWPPARIEAAAEAPHGPGPLTDEERVRIVSPVTLDSADPPVRGDYPDWLEPMMARAFGEERIAEGEALAARAPVDLRVNTLKADPERVARALAPFQPAPSAVLPNALRMAPPAAHQRAAAVEATPAFEKGWFEVQDLGSQVAAACAGEVARLQVLDFCAGGGGKTLALAAAMGNTGQLWAHDTDARRLAEVVRRARRAGVRNLQILDPRQAEALAPLRSRIDVVFVDAPCTGSGAWRRHPDAKWRLTPAQLERRKGEQDAVLAAAADCVKPGGRLVYVTCSIFAEENEDRISAFLARFPHFAPAIIGGAAESFGQGLEALRLTPRSAGTDGFFIAALRRAR
ncbi:MAG TPA: RsmB/NOP family class I SAM-dependent RNA methyltransferase [Caulobacteraceae bacterium]|nr:RsmB/NOP family class I SAM-dependent RNA methyltransferase [Caulobacteraceae bacterium]